MDNYEKINDESDDSHNRYRNKRMVQQPPTMTGTVVA